MNNEAIMAIYEEVSEITTRMLAAAVSNEWEVLAQLEKECSSRVAVLEKHDTNSSLSEVQRQQKMDLIKKILEDDRQIREITEPWMVKLSTMINHSNVSRKLNQAYGNNQTG